MNQGSIPAWGVISGAPAGNHYNQVAFGEAPNAARVDACAPQK